MKTVFLGNFGARPGVWEAILAKTTGPTMAVYASWNGATAVTSWQLLTGPSASRLTPVSTTPNSGFETTIPARAAPFLQVRALGASGRVLGTSRVVQPTSA